MASKGSSSECSTGQCPKQYPRFYVSNIPKFLTQIGIKTYFENSVGKVLDVELLPEAAVVTFDGLQGIDKMSSPHHIADQKLNVLHLYTEKTTLEISSPAASGLSGEIKELAGRWGVTMQAQGNTITITGHCDRVYAFRVDFSKYVNAKLIPLSNPSVATPTEAVGSYPQTQPTETTYPSMASGTSDGHLQETQAGGGIESDTLSKLSTVSETRQVFSNLSPDALALLEKNSEEEMLGVSYYTKAGRVQIEGQSKSELEDRISRFQSAYQSILTPRRLKAEPVPVPPALDDAQVTLMVASFNSKYTQCVFVYHEGPPRMIKVVSVSSRQFDQAKKLLMEALSCSPTSAPASFPTLEVISFANGRRLTLKKANIVHENVDVIVNAANERLQHWGGVAGALNKASHGVLQRYSDSYVQQKGLTPVGCVAVTHGGDGLKCKLVIHAVGPDSTYSPPECKRLIAQAINESLTKAEKRNFTSMAIPAISSGIFGVSKDLVASCVIDTIISHKFSKAVPVLSDIRIVIIDEATYSCFAWHFNQRKAQLLGQVAPKQPPESQSAGVDNLVDIEPEVPSQPPGPVGQSSKLDPAPPIDGAGQSDAAQSLQNVLAPSTFKKEDANLAPSFGSEQSATIVDQELHHDSSPPQSHNEHLLTSEDLPTLVTCLKAVPHKWEALAIQLGLDSTTRAKLRVQHFNTAEKLEKMLTVRLQRAEPPPTLEMLVSALASQSVKEDTLAMALPGLLQQARTGHLSLPSPTVSNPNCNVEGGAITPYPQLGTNLQPDNTGAVTKTVLPQNQSPGTEPPPPNLSPGTEPKPTDNEVALGNDPLSATNPSPHQPHGNSAGAHVTTNTADLTTSKASYSQVARGHGASTISATSTGDEEGSDTKPSAGGGITMPGHVLHGKSNPKTGGTGTGGHHGKPVNPNPGANAKAANCSICLEPFKNPAKTKCGHTFCTQCLQNALHHSPYCPTCRKPLRKIIGNQPPGTMAHKVLYNQHLPGYHGYNTIEIVYNIPNGTQGPEHPNPGRPFSGAVRVAYLPDTTAGREVLKLLKKAFDARLVFTVGTSVTSGRKDTVVWNDIHHKTNKTGGQQHYGYPDETYLQRVKEDLAAKGIVPDGSHASTSV